MAKKRVVKKRLSSKKRKEVVKSPVIKSVNENFQINFEVRWGFSGYIRGNMVNGKQSEIRVKVGCAGFSTRQQAEQRWKDGRSIESGESRPHAAEFIEWCSAEFEKRGYKW